MTGDTHTDEHILVVEDDESLARWIADYLASHGFMVSVATRGDEALIQIENDTPDLVILDLNLPVIDGLEVCRRARKFFNNPVLMLTARDDDTDEILGLNSGADDYLGKPVVPRILLARVHALLRRGKPSATATHVTIGSLSIDTESRTVKLEDEIISVSTHEFDVLLLLANNVGHALSRNALVIEIRGIEYDGFDRSVDVCISRLRRKLGDDANTPKRIKTLRGTGYMLAADAF